MPGKIYLSVALCLRPECDSVVSPSENRGASDDNKACEVAEGNSCPRLYQLITLERVIGARYRNLRNRRLGNYFITDMQKKKKRRKALPLTKKINVLYLITKEDFRLQSK